MAFTLTTITGTFEEADSTPQTGRITAILSSRMVNGVVDVEPEVTVGVLDAAGTLKTEAGNAFTLLANDDAGTTPAGTYYIFHIELDGSPIRSFEAVVPSGAPGHTIDLSVLDA